MIEPVDGHCFQSDPCELLAGVHGGHPVRIRLELAKGPRNFRIRRHPAANGADSLTLRDFRRLMGFAESSGGGDNQKNVHRT